MVFVSASQFKSFEGDLSRANAPIQTKDKVIWVMLCTVRKTGTSGVQKLYVFPFKKNKKRNY